MTRLDYLRSHLLPPGTPMKDVPPDFRGLTYAEYMELQALEYLMDRPSSPGEPWINSLPVATARDRYGWRSLPSGSTLLWKDKSA